MKGLIGCAVVLLSLLVACGVSQPDIVNIDVYATEIAPMSISIKAGGEHVYHMWSLGSNMLTDTRWMVGMGGGIRTSRGKWSGIADVIHYKVNEGLEWTQEVNELTSVRFLVAWHTGRVKILGGLTLNRLLSTVVTYKTFNIREGSHGNAKSSWWPGFLAGVQF